jgi:hypothetical protein
MTCQKEVARHTVRSHPSYVDLYGRFYDTLIDSILSSSMHASATRVSYSNSSIIAEQSKRKQQFLK